MRRTKLTSTAGRVLPSGEILTKNANGPYRDIYGSRAAALSEPEVLRLSVAMKKYPLLAMWRDPLVAI